MRGGAIGAKALDPKAQPFLDVALTGAAAAIVTRNRVDFPTDAGITIAWPEDVLAWFAPADLRRWLDDGRRPLARSIGRRCGQAQPIG